MTLPDFSSFQKGFSVLNELELSKLPKLMSRLAKNFEDSKKGPFLDDEKEKICEALGIDMKQLDTLLEVICHVFKKAAYYNWKPANLSQELSGHLKDEVGEIVCQVWQACGKEIIAKLKKKTLAANQLEKVDWHLNLQIAQQSKSKITEPSAVFQLQMKESYVRKNGDLLMEFSHEELLQFYNKLETIQEQLDALS